jgi:hypothetical protein
LRNSYEPAWQHRCQTVTTWGKDSTGQIQYKFNSLGFRSQIEYDWKPSIAFFGNSIVFGVGVTENERLTSYFPHCQNYGLSGSYMNHHSVTNLRQFVNSDLYQSGTRIVFFWIERPEIENIPELIKQVDDIVPDCLHISSGQKYAGAINLMPAMDQDVSGTHPGPKTHRIWARTIQLLLNRD